VDTRKILGIMQETTIIKKTFETKLANKNYKEMHNKKNLIKELEGKKKMEMNEIVGALWCKI
jgi:hypothetical protein